MRTFHAWTAPWIACAAGALLTVSSNVAMAEPAECNSANPPPPARPYFLFVIDNSGSMDTALTPAPSCSIANGYPSDYPGNRMGHARCAIYNTVNAFSGLVNFGLMSFPGHDIKDSDANPNNNPVTCPNSVDTISGCTETSLFADTCGSGSGATRRSAKLNTAIQQDNYWDDPSLATPTNVPSLLKWVDNNCSDCIETSLMGSTPLAGALHSAHDYLSSQWTHPLSGISYGTPLVGTAVGERACRSVNVILLTDGGETCDTGDPPGAPTTWAGDAAKQLYDGITVGGILWKVKVHAIALAGTSTTLTDVALYGGTGTQIQAANEAELSQALANIISGAIQPETCDNLDNNCNGCTDEGFARYCNRNQTCCSWADDTARNTCLTSYFATVTPANPQGNLALLPCTTATNQTEPTHWLCVNPGDTCDDLDNNCDAQVDEGQVKCGSPAHCPTTETCNDTDDNCDGVVDNAAMSSTPYSICPNNCQGLDELCNGCDEDCDGIADNGVPNLACAAPGGLNGSQAPNCQNGFRSCTAQPVGGPKACAPGAPKDNYSACVFPNAGPNEICGNGQDDDCDGAIDNGPAVACFPYAQFPNVAPGAVDAANSRCKSGLQACSQNSTCQGYVGPLNIEICNGIDDDCDGLIDEPADLVGVGVACGTSTGPCDPGVTQCINGAVVCTGGTQPQPELCDGIDNDCDGTVDNNVVDGPDTTVDMNADHCWPGKPDMNGNCAAGETLCTCNDTSCAGLKWCAPSGASCSDFGSLVTDGLCSLGTIQCKQATWTCVGGASPSPEICDGADNNCDGQLNEGIPTPVCNQNPAPGSNGMWPAGSPCTVGTLICVPPGVQSCVDAMGNPVVVPSEELCDGIDNDCDGETDEGIGAINQPCQADYDTTQYPGDRTGGVCHPGTYQCMPGGMGAPILACVGALGPSPEVCDNLDNDCDGDTDEVGAAPDGISGTTNPDDNTQVIGQPCNTQVLAPCTAGTFACVGGKFSCEGGIQPKPETCNCVDDDCDGEVDEDNEVSGDTVNVCGSGSSATCVSYGGICQCALPCASGEFKCQVGFTCEDPKRSGTDQTVNDVCVTSAEEVCGDCASKRVPPTGSPVECGPDGQIDGVPIPLCECMGLDGCHAPCFKVSCETGKVCTNFGPNKGQCVSDNCFNVPCSAGSACTDAGVCVDDPCDPNPCDANQACVPTEDLSTHQCKESCAGVTCNAGQTCIFGQCVDTGCGSTGCPTGQVCDGMGCIDDKCLGITCPGSLQWCNPLTGVCENDPCTGVKCPADQICSNGQCITDSHTGGTGGSAGSGGSSGSSGSGGSSGTNAGATGGTGGSNNGATAGTAGTNASGASGNSGASGSGAVKGVFGVPTGGGGCSVSEQSDSKVGLLAGLLAMFGLSLRKSRKTEKNAMRPGSDSQRNGAKKEGSR